MRTPYFFITFFLLAQSADAGMTRKFTRNNPDAIGIFRLNEGLGSTTKDREASLSSMTLTVLTSWTVKAQTVMEPTLRFSTTTYANNRTGINVPSNLLEHIESTLTAVYNLYNTSFTMVVTVKPNAYVSTYRTVVNYCTGGAGWALDLDNNNIFNFAFCGVASDLFAQRLENLLPHCYVVTYNYDSNLLKLYVDGRFSANLTLGGRMNSVGATTKLQFGEKANAGHGKFTGVFYEFGFFRNEWTAAEVKNHFEEEHGSMGWAMLPAGK